MTYFTLEVCTFWPFSLILPRTHPSLKQSPNCSMSCFFFFFLGFYIWVRQKGIFSSSDISFSIMPSQSIHVVENGRILFMSEWYSILFVCMCVCALMYLFFFFRAALAAYWSSQPRGQIRASAASLHHNHSNGQIRAVSVTYTSACGNARFLTHWVVSEARDCLLLTTETMSGSYPTEPLRGLPCVHFLIRLF